MNNKAKYLLYGALIAIIGGGVPYFMGQLVETKFKDVVALIPEINPQISAQTVKYERGWLTSHAQTRITINNPQLLKPYLSEGQKDPASFSVLFEHDIHHGPFVRVNPKSYKDWVFARAVIHSKLLLKEKSKEVLKAEIGENDLFTLNSQIKMDGAVLFNLVSKKIEHKKPAETAIWQGLQGKWQLSPRLDRFQGEMVAPGLDYIAGDSHLILQNLAVKNDYQRTTESFWVGKGEVTIKHFKWEQKAANLNLVIEGFTGGGLVDLHDKFLDTFVNFRIEKISDKAEVYGPVLIDISLKNLSSALYKSILEITKDPRILDNTGLATQKLLSLLPEILRTRPILTLENLKIRTKDGDIQGMFTIAIGGSELSGNADFNQIFQSIAAQANLTVPKVIFKDWLIHDLGLSFPKEEAPQKAETFIAEWINQGTLIDKGNTYFVQVELVKGAFKINGKDFKLPLGNPAAAPTQPFPQIPAN